MFLIRSPVRIIRLLFIISELQYSMISLKLQSAVFQNRHLDPELWYTIVHDEIKLKLKCHNFDLLIDVSQACSYFIQSNQLVVLFSSKWKTLNTLKNNFPVIGRSELFLYTVSLFCWQNRIGMNRHLLLDRHIILWKGKSIIKIHETQRINPQLPAKPSNYLLWVCHDHRFPVVQGVRHGEGRWGERVVTCPYKDSSFFLFFPLSGSCPRPWASHSLSVSACEFLSSLVPALVAGWVWGGLSGLLEQLSLILPPTHPSALHVFWNR